MFLKKLHRKKNGKGHTYWALVESVRTARGPRHRVVSYLGELTPTERAGWAELGAQFARRPAFVQRRLFEQDDEADPVPEHVSVNVRGVRVSKTTDFGSVWLGLLLWRALGLEELFAEVMARGREGVRWGVLAAVLVLARFCEPSSERHIAEQWYPHTVLPDLLGISPERMHVQRLYRALDVLAEQKEVVEEHLGRRLGELFDVPHDLLLYDVTSTYFEGQAEGNSQAKRGYSRDHRGDCKQVCIGLVVAPDGLPLGYEVFDGNRNDMTTVEAIVEAMEAKYGRARRIWVLDRGMVNEENLEFIRERGGYYVVGTPRSQLRRFEQELTGSGWSTVHEDVEVKLCPGPYGEETFVLCRSAARAEKERAMRERFSERIETGLGRLERRLARAKRRPNRSQVERQIGRLLARNSRASGRYEVEVHDDPDRPGHLRLAWSERQDWTDWAALRDGAYLLRTNLNDHTPEDLWRTYVQLTDAEAAFRTIKTDLVVRPIYHQTRRRVHAHILVAFLAYAMWKTLQKWMEQAGLGRGVRTVMEEIGRIKCCDVVLPTRGGREIELRCVSRPDGHQRTPLQRLGLKLPARLGQPRWRGRIDTLSGM
jgi:transposase